jgi:hypothetical protein
MADAEPGARLSPMITGGSRFMSWFRTWPRRRYKNMVTAWASAGAGAGLLLGMHGGIIIVASIIYSFGFTYYAVTLVGLAILASVPVGIVSGLMVGLLNGVVLGVVSRTTFFRSRAGVMQSRVSAVTALTTGLGGLAVLHALFGRDVLFVYPPAIVGALLATLLGRRLPPIRRQQPTSE